MLCSGIVPVWNATKSRQAVKCTRGDGLSLDLNPYVLRFPSPGLELAELMTTPDPSPVIDLIDAFRRSKAMFTAVRLGVFDRLEAGPAGLVELAADFSANPDALERLLDANVGLGLLVKTSDGAYANTDCAAAYL